jgi:hypothetical protein
MTRPPRLALIGLLVLISHAAFLVNTSKSTAKEPDPGTADWMAAWTALPEWSGSHQRPATDWLIDPSPYVAKVWRGPASGELVLSNGLLARTFRLTPNAATVGLDQLTTGETLLRGVKPEAVLEISGQRCEVGGLVGQPNYAFLRREWIDQLKASPTAFQFVGFEVGKPTERFGWNRVRHCAPQTNWPPSGVSLRLDFIGPTVSGTTENATPSIAWQQVRISVHYEMYDGIPCYCKWITLTNNTDQAITIDRCSSEVLAVVERVSEVDELTAGRTPPAMHIETDMAFGGMMAAGANRRSFRWLPDPDFHTQVNYEKKTPCLLDVGPDLGPAQTIASGEQFESLRAWVLPYENTERERCGLAVRKMYRTIAPWVTENPLMMHVRYADEKTVKAAIDQCAEVGFELVILTFGSGFDLENEQPEVLKIAQQYSDYARQKGIEIGSYSLLASRRINDQNDVVMPEGQKPTFGNSPCLGSPWGERYFARLYDFYKQSGFTLLEHDGSYPGDVCASETHPGHHGLADSRWNQWRTISSFYRWCRGQGIFLNVPDHYFLSGSNKTGMGYREVNWSLPRAQQVIHTRQNIFDGTWEKAPSMGWMFVPLTEYQGGGEAATIEPLDAHLDHYERMVVSNLAMGVQACYRGPRLYDTDRTKAMLQRWVTWFKAHREILESDLVHGRRADARDIDWMLHVNPQLNEKGMLVVFNPLDEPVRRTLDVNLYYTGLTDTAQIESAQGDTQTIKLQRNYHIEIPVEVPAGGMTWYVIR